MVINLSFAAAGDKMKVFYIRVNFRIDINDSLYPKAISECHELAKQIVEHFYELTKHSIFEEMATKEGLRRIRKTQSTRLRRMREAPRLKKKKLAVHQVVSANDITEVEKLMENCPDAEMDELQINILYVVI